MATHRYGTTSVLAISVLIAGLTPGPARADDGTEERERTIRLYATASSGPIGMTRSLAAFAINGRNAYGEQWVWNGDLLQASEGTNLRISLDSIGQITLSGGAAARLATRWTSVDEQSRRRVLVATLLGGYMVVNLLTRAAACVEAGVDEFVATPGAGFRIGVRGDRAVVDAESGTLIPAVRPLDREPTLESVAIDPSNPNGPPTGKGSNTFRVSPDQSKDIYVKLAVAEQKGKRTHKRTSTVLAGYLPEADSAGAQSIGSPEAVPNTMVQFSLSAPVGTIDRSVAITNAWGVAHVLFTAGHNRASAEITATAIVEGRTAKWTGRIFITPVPAFWRTIVMAAPPALATTLIIVDRKSKIKLAVAGPPIIIP